MLMELSAATADKSIYGPILTSASSGFEPGPQSLPVGRTTYLNLPKIYSSVVWRACPVSLLDTSVTISLSRKKSSFRTYVNIVSPLTHPTPQSGRTNVLSGRAPQSDTRTEIIAQIDATLIILDFIRGTWDDLDAGCRQRLVAALEDCRVDWTTAEELDIKNMDESQGSDGSWPTYMDTIWKELVFAVRDLIPIGSQCLVLRTKYDAGVRGGLSYFVESTSNGLDSEDLKVNFTVSPPWMYGRLLTELRKGGKFAGLFFWGRCSRLVKVRAVELLQNSLHPDDRRFACFLEFL